MIQRELLRERGILILKPEGALQAEDFAALGATVDPYIEQHGEIKGLVIDAPSSPGWENFAALLSHRRFVRGHHRRVRRLAVLSDSALLAFVPKIASHFVSAQVRTFKSSGRAEALAWIEAGS